MANEDLRGSQITVLVAENHAVVPHELSRKGEVTGKVDYEDQRCDCKSVETERLLVERCPSLSFP